MRVNMKLRVTLVTTTIGAAMLATTGVATAPAAAAAADRPGHGRTYFVSTGGDDGRSGRSPRVAFRTIQRCASLARPGDTCVIAGGVYRETVTPRRSGAPGAPITFRAARGAKVTVDGTDAVTGWTPDSGNIYRASVTLSGTAEQPYSSTEYPANSDLWANQIFLDGSMAPEAAYPPPSADPWSQAFINGGWSSTRSAGGDCNPAPCTTTLTGTLTYDNFPAFGDMTGAVAYFAGGWVALSATVTGGNLDGTNKTLDISFPQSDDNVYPGGGNNRKLRLVGKKAFLTGPNQWYYDAGTKELFVWAPDGAVPTNVTAKKRNYAFDLRDRSYINVSDVALWANTVTTDDASSNIVLDGIDGQYLSHWQTAQYVSTLPFAGIYDANHRYDSGILLHGRDNALRNSTLQQSAGNGVNLMGAGHAVVNNHIHNVSYGGTYTAAVTIEVGASDMTIMNNSMHDTGRDVINMNTNAFPNAGYTNMRIAYNNIYAYAKIAFDLGGIYVCCDTSLAGTRIDHNWIHDPVHTGNGMHLDNGTIDVTVDHNVIWGLKSVGNINHGGNGINFGGHTNRPPAGSSLPYLRGSFFNNTIVAGKGYTIFNYFATAAHVANTTVKNNILDGAHPAGRDYGHIAGGDPDDSNNLVTTMSLDGTGIDPRYTDVTVGDFTVAADSPAVDAGVSVPGITDGYTGANPDIGAYESGSPRWVAGCTLAGC
ncbi:MAG TPA: right-handed parallel beta-helix repeat-containing protein [Micromonosporaceae bacterium]|nr:right-handed parallel beta-helix repeat-containing protein [Micromonosporaceae bacterium]